MTQSKLEDITDLIQDLKQEQRELKLEEDLKKGAELHEAYDNLPAGQKLGFDLFFQGGIIAPFAILVGNASNEMAFKPFIESCSQGDVDGMMVTGLMSMLYGGIIASASYFPVKKLVVEPAKKGFDQACKYAEKIKPEGAYF